MEFSYPKTFNLEAKETGSKRRSGYDIRRIEMAALPDRFDASRLVTLEYYAPRSDAEAVNHCFWFFHLIKEADGRVPNGSGGAAIIG